MNIKKIAGALILVYAFTAFTGCKAKPVKTIETYKDNYVVEHFFEEFEGISGGEYEVETITWERSGIQTSFDQIGPTEPLYRGYMYLDEKIIPEFIREYEWVETKNKPKVKELDIGTLEGITWYECKQFEQDINNGSISISAMYYDKDSTIYFEFRDI